MDIIYECAACKHFNECKLLDNYIQGAEVVTDICTQCNTHNEVRIKLKVATVSIIKCPTCLCEGKVLSEAENIGSYDFCECKNPSCKVESFKRFVDESGKIETIVLSIKEEN